MKKLLISLLTLFLSFPLTAQTDYLESAKSLAAYKGELGEYYRNVFTLLNTGFQSLSCARYYAIPSFSPEYAMSVEKKNGRCYLISNTLSHTYWQSEKGSVKVGRKMAGISPNLYKSLGTIFHLVTNQIQDMDGFSGGMDGVVYYFASTDPKGKILMGRKWSPEKGTLMERLVQICQSAYLLSVGGNLSEKTLNVEASTLLNELQDRTKGHPDAYKTPIYAGAYSIGAQQKGLAGKRPIDELPRFPKGSAEEYIAAQMIYPAGLLEKNVGGYVLCEFTIDKEGAILRPHILKSTFPELAEEALRLVKGMPKWIPALTGDKAVECDYTLYIPFRPKLYRERK